MQSLSQGYLRPADGIIRLGAQTGSGVDFGGVNYRDRYYRVMGTDLFRIDALGNMTNLGSVNANQQVTFATSFDYLAVASNGGLYYFDETAGTITQVLDPNLGAVLDVVWVDGYFMTTDGEYIVVTELNNPLTVNPLKYGSSEIDPDPIVSLKKIRNEVYVINRYTIEIFNNIGGVGFPFQRVEGAQIQKGALGKNCTCIFNETLAFIGSGHNEAPGIYLGVHGQVTKLSTHEVDLVLSTLTEIELSTCILESRTEKGVQWLYIHLPDRTLVYDLTSSQAVNFPVWFILSSSQVGVGQYVAQNLVWVYNKWMCGHPTSNIHGYLTNQISSHYGDLNEWEINSQIVYGEGKRGVFHEIELVALPGRVALGINPVIFTSYSLDGISWSVEVPCSMGTTGSTFKKIAWLQCGPMWNWRTQKFRGNSLAHMAIARLEARIEATNG